MGKERIGFFGGTFDPVHNGHLQIAEIALASGKVDYIFFVPAAQNPLKKNSPTESELNRLALIQCAISDKKNMGVLDDEFHLPQPSYTYRTIAHFKNKFPEAEFYWLIGSDQLANLPRWYEIEKLVLKIKFLLFARDTTFVIPSIKNLDVECIPNPVMEVSSSEIKWRLLKGIIPKDLLPISVSKMIQDYSFYGINTKSKKLD